MTNLVLIKVRSLLAISISLSLAASAFPPSAWAVDADVFAHEVSETGIIAPVVISGNDFAIGDNISREELPNTPNDPANMISGISIPKDSSMETSVSINPESQSAISSGKKDPQTAVITVPARSLSKANASIKKEFSKELSLRKIQKGKMASMISNAIHRIHQGISSWEDGKRNQEISPQTEVQTRSKSAHLAQAKIGAKTLAFVLPVPQQTASAINPETKISKFKSLMHWTLPIVSLIIVIVTLDAGTKLFAMKHLHAEFHQCAWRVPLLAFIVPYVGFTAYSARSGMPKGRKLRQWSAKNIFNGHFGFYKIEVSGVDGMIKHHPSLRWAMRLYDISISMMMGGMLGNGLDALRLGGALDWIPLGRSLMNLADVSLLMGLAFFQLATSFLISAGEADHSGKSLRFNITAYLGLPIVGFFIAWMFGTTPSMGILDLAMKNIAYLYLMGFSMLIGISRFISALIMGRFVARFISDQDKDNDKLPIRRQ
jgi:lipoprotein signal peptidase